MEISYQLTEDDYRQGFKAFRRRSKYSRWSYRIAYGCFLLLLAVTPFLLFFGRNQPFSDYVPLFILIAFWVWCLWYGPRRVARKMIKGSPSAALPHVLEATENGLHFSTSASDSRLTWDLITEWVEVDRVFTLFFSPVSFLPIPKRAMTDLQQNEMRTLLRNKVSNRKR